MIKIYVSRDNKKKRRDFNRETTGEKNKKRQKQPLAESLSKILYPYTTQNYGSAKIGKRKV